MFLTENSLFTTQAERDALVGDKRAVANLFYLNFLGFLGLVKIDDKKGAMISYIASEKKLRPATIDATNNDASLVIKLALDANIIRTVAAIQATKLLVLIKQKRVTSATMDEKAIRDILEACRIQTNRPDQRIYNVVQEFIDGKTDLAHTTAALYKVSRLPDYTKMTDEWRDLVTRGGYTGQLIKLQSAAAGITQTPAPAPTTAARQIVMGRTNSNSMPPQNAQSGSDADYMHCLLHMFKMRTVGQGYLERFGFKASFDEKRFIEFVKRPDFILPDNPHITSWDKHPFALWIKKRSMTAFNAFVAAAASAKTGGAVPQTMTSPAATPTTTIAPPAPVSRPAPVQAVKVEIITAQSIDDLISAQSVTGVQALMRQYNWGRDTFTMNMTKFASLVKTAKPEHDIVTFRLRLFNLANFFPKKSEFMDAYAAAVFRTWTEGDKVTPGVVRNQFVLLLDLLNGYVNNPEALFTEYFTKMLIESHGVLSKEKIMNNQEHYSAIFQRVGNVLHPVMEKAWLHFLRTNSFDPNTGSLFAWLFELQHFQKTNFESTLTTLLPSNKWYKDGSRYYIDSETMAEVLRIKVTDLQRNRMSGIYFEKISDVSSRVLKQKIIAAFEIARWGNLPDDDFDPLMANLTEIYKLEPDINLFASKYTYSFISDNIWDRIANELDANTLKAMLFDLVQTPKLLTINMWFTYIPILIDSAGLNGVSFETWKVVLKSVKSSFGVRSAELGEMVIKHILKSKDVLKLLQDEELAISFDQLSRAVHGVHGVWVEEMRHLPRHRPCSANADDLAGTANLLRKYKAANGLQFTGAIEWRTIHAAVTSAYNGLNSVSLIEPGDAQWDDLLAEMNSMSPQQFSPSYSGENRMVSTWCNVWKIFNPAFYTEYANRMKAMIDMTAIVNVVGYAAITPDREDAEKAITKYVESRNGGDWDNLLVDGKVPRLLTMIKLTREWDDNKGKTTFKLLKRFLSNVTVMKVGGMYKPALDSLIESVVDTIVTMHENGQINEANELFSIVPNGTRNAIIKAVGEVEYMSRIKDQLYSHDIKPDVDLTPERMRTVLKYNSLKVKIPSGKKAVAKIEDIKPQAHKVSATVEDLKVKDLPTTPEEYDRITVELDGLGNNKHGDFKMKVLKRWDVEFPGARERFDAFVAANPGTTIMPRVWHGTGTVAASMILRNGFTIIPEKDDSAVGRALGNGIYFTDVINKAGQYMAESGYARKYGTRGYMLEMEAALGRNNIHHRSAGFKGSTDEYRNFLSPEYAVFDPANQLRIFRVYYVEVISPKYFETIKARSATASLNESKKAPIMNFDDYLTENVVTSGKETSIITFMDGSIATMKGTAIEVEDYKPPRGVSLMHTPEGPALQIEHSADIEPVIIKVPTTLNWMAEFPEQYEMFKQLMAG